MSDDIRADGHPDSAAHGDAGAVREDAARTGSPASDDDIRDAPGVLSALGTAGGRVLRTKPARVFFHYLTTRGPLMGAGLAYQAIFAVFAAVWLVFAAAALVIGQDEVLRQTLIDAAASAVPGLIETGGQEGAIQPDRLLSGSILGSTGVIALIGVLAAVLSWLESAREAVRTIFALPIAATNFLLLKLKDLGLALVFGVALLVSTVLSALSTQLLDSALGFLGFDDSWVTTVLGRLAGLLVVLALDTTVLAALYRVLSSVTIPLRRLFGGALIGGVAVGALKVVGSALLGSTSRNPLFASFIVIIGLLIWFNLVCQAILVASAWIAVGMTDGGIAADPEAEALRIEADRQRAAQEAAAREAEIERRVAALAARQASLRAGADAPAAAPSGSLSGVRGTIALGWRRLRGMRAPRRPEGRWLRDTGMRLRHTGERLRTRAGGRGGGGRADGGGRHSGGGESGSGSGSGSESGSKNPPREGGAGGAS